MPAIDLILHIPKAKDRRCVPWQAFPGKSEDRNQEAENNQYVQKRNRIELPALFSESSARTE
jgi:hypothetical protein